MLPYDEYLTLSHSFNDEDRARTAHLTALCFLDHQGPADERQALYEAMVAFLSDPADVVRAALAYGLIGSPEAPRPILLVLLRDAPPIARAVAQCAVALTEGDLLLAIADGNEHLCAAIARRPHLSRRLVSALLAGGRPDVFLVLAARADVVLAAETLEALARHALAGSDALRLALLGRADLPADVRMTLLSKSVTPEAAPLTPEALPPSPTAPEAGSLATPAPAAPQPKSVGGVYLLRLLIEGDMGSFAARLAGAACLPSGRTESLLRSAVPQVLRGLFDRCGIEPVLLDTLVTGVLHARSVDFGADPACRRLVAAALINDLTAEHGLAMPSELRIIVDYLERQVQQLTRTETRRAA